MSTSRDDPNYRHAPNEELVGDYEVQCQKCKTRRFITEYTSMNWTVGDIMGKDPSDPRYGRCYKCGSYGLKIIRTPTWPSETGPVGFTRIPKE